MSERVEFISPEPRLAKLLRSRRPLVVPEVIHKFALDWVEDVGTVMRSREYKVGFVASAAGYGLVLLLASVFPAARRLGVVSQALGIAER
jgi:hypothetical protein